jgi:hypothetical protein
VEKIMKQLGLGIIVAIGLTFPALADPPQLKGDYVWTYDETCLVSPSGFSAPPGLAPGGASALGQTYSSSTSNTGVQHFNGDGTGFVKGGGMGVNLGSPPLPAGSGPPATFSIQFTYVFNSDDTFTVTTVPGTFIGYDASGKASFMLNGNQWIGKVSKDAKSLTETAVTPFVQVLTLISPPTILFYQMCRSNIVGFAAD